MLCCDGAVTVLNCAPRLYRGCATAWLCCDGAVAVLWLWLCVSARYGSYGRFLEGSPAQPAYMPFQGPLKQCPCYL